MNDFPNVIEFQTHNLCNANCIICPYKEIVQDTYYMSDDMFKKLLLEVGNKNVKLVPYLNNEPFMDQCYIEKLKTINQLCPNSNIEISTNLSCLDEKKIKEIEEVDIYELRLSIFAYKKETYHLMMPKLDYEKTMYNLNLIINSNLKRSINKIGIVMIEHPYVPEKEYAEMKQFCENNKLEFWKWGFLDRAGNNSYFTNNVNHYEVVGCEQNRPLERMHILADGEVVLCCQDWRKEVLIGNLRYNNIFEIWNSEEYHEIRKGIYNYDMKCNKLCTKCKLSIVKEI